MEEQKFQSLLPKDDIALDSYQAALDYAMIHDEIRNVALSGSYGSGKSSVMNSYEKCCAGKTFIHISLADFEKEEPTNSSKEIAKRLEGKILNQLLHQINPENIKQSHFRVKADHAPNRRLRWVLFCTIYTFILLYSVRFSEWQKFASTLPPGLLDVSWTASPSIRVIAILLCFIMGGYALYHFTQEHDLSRIFKKLDVKGIVGIEVFENNEDSYFDKYLNEVLYLFEHSGADAIVFEDLDRYNVTQIFEKLKEISDLLYQRKRIGSVSYPSTSKGKKVKSQEVSKNETQSESRKQHQEEKSSPKFFYLIRDDVFSSSDRSKFFDFIIPVVPVISTDNSYNLMKERFTQAGFENEFSQRFLREVSLYLTDLRLINNIVNEYIVYDGLLDRSELSRTTDCQLAIIIYKNLFPKDFEQLQHGTGYVYSLFALREKLLENQQAEAKREIEEITLNLDHANQEPLHSIDELNALLLPESSNIYSIDGRIPDKKLSRTEFVKELLSATSANYLVRSGSLGTIDIHSIRTQMENDPEYQRRKQAIENQSGKKAAHLKSRLEEIKQDLRLQNTQKFCELTTDDDDFWLMNFLPEEKRQDFNYITSCREFELLKYLIRNGYLNEDYSIYISYFYPNSLTVRDKNFLLRLNNRQTPDYTYLLDSPALLLEWIDESYFALEEIGNFALFNYLLETENRHLLKIWIESLKHWCDISEAAFDFPVALLQNSPHRYYLIRVINEYAPDWFEKWTELELLIENEWRQYAVDTLCISDSKVLHKMNRDGWLGKAITDREDFLQIDTLGDVQKFVAGLRILNIRFCNLSIREQDIPLAKRIYCENLYQMNSKMLTLWLELFYDATVNEIPSKSYTYLIAKPNELLSIRVNANLSEYLEAIFEQDGTHFYDSPRAVLALLNHPEIDKDYGETYISRMNTVIEGLTDVIQTVFWPILLDKDCIAFQWKNIIDYYMEFCAGTNSFDAPLIGFLQRGNNDIAWTWDKLHTKIGKEEVNAFYSKLIRCTNLSIERYQMILKPLGAHYDSFAIDDLPDEYVQVLIKLGIIAMTAKNVKFMRLTYPKQMVNFILQDRCKKFIALIKKNEVAIEKAELANLLEDKRFDSGMADRILELYDGTLPLENKKYSEAIQVRIIENYFDVGDINWFLLNYNRQTPRIQTAFLHCVQNHIEELCEAAKAEEQIPIPVYAYTLQAMQPEEAKTLRQYLPDPNYELVCITNRKPTFPGAEDVKTILEYFKKQGWISSYQLQLSGRYKAFSKQKKAS